MLRHEVVELVLLPRGVKYQFSFPPIGGLEWFGGAANLPSTQTILKHSNRASSIGKRILSTVHMCQKRGTGEWKTQAIKQPWQPA